MTDKPKRPRDANQLAKFIVDLATGDVQDHGDAENNMAKLGRQGGLKGGKARAEALTPEHRRDIAKKAAEARWKK